MTYWHRQYKLSFPELKLEFANTLRVKFDVNKDSTKETNKSKITIYNLSDTTRQQIEIADRKVELYVGYRDNGGPVRLCVGSVISSKTTDNGKETETELTISDGQSAIRDTAFTLSFAPGTAGNTIIQHIANAMGVAVVFGDGVQFGTFKNGYSFVGTAGDALNGICYGSGCKWSVQNEVLQVIMNNGVFANRGITFATDSGLIGFPERVTESSTKPDKETAKRKRERAAKKEVPRRQSGWKIKTLLSPTITPGDLVKIESKEVTGWFRVESAHHSGDTHGNEWTSEIKLISRSIAPTALNNTVDDTGSASSGDVAENFEIGCEAVDASQGGYVENGCVYRCTQAGSYWSPFMAEENQNGVLGVGQLYSDADAKGLVVPYDESSLEVGDTIVYREADDSDWAHVASYDGNGGVWHNSYSNQCWYHQEGDVSMGSSEYPAYIIKSSQG